jgi:hypothetical protein
MESTQRAGRDQAGMDRRIFLRGTAALPRVYAAGGGRLLAEGEGGTSQPGQGAAYPGLIVRQSKPENYEFPFPTLHSFATPNHLFYVRTHFGIYRGADRRRWRLRVPPPQDWRRRGWRV